MLQAMIKTSHHIPAYQLVCLHAYLEVRTTDGLWQQCRGLKKIRGGNGKPQISNRGDYGCSKIYLCPLIPSNGRFFAPNFAFLKENSLTERKLF